jgi:hypothetical protein
LKDTDCGVACSISTVRGAHIHFAGQFMGLRISAAEFDALPDALKTRFAADGDEYALIEEDVEGLKKSKAAILAEKKQLADKLAELEKFKAELESQKTAEEAEAMKAAGQFAELEKRLRETLETERQKAEAERAQLLGTLKRERLLNELTKRGVLADRARYALADLEPAIEIEPGADGFALKVKNGIGDANEFETLVQKMKTDSPFFFESAGASGSGASGSGNGNGAGAKQIQRAQFEQLPPTEQMKFIQSGGKVTD